MNMYCFAFERKSAVNCPDSCFRFPYSKFLF